jgi:hypothetical protein
LDDRDRELATREEARLLAGEGHQVGLREDVQVLLLLQGLQENLEVAVGRATEQRDQRADVDGVVEDEVRVPVRGRALGGADVDRVQCAAAGGSDRRADEGIAAGDETVHAQGAQRRAADLGHAHVDLDLRRAW